MHTAQYTTTANGAGEVGQYPLSTETLEFIQQQVLLLERLSSLVGVDRPWIIKSPGREEKDEGLLAYNGALYPIESPGTSLVPPNRYRLLLREEYKDIFTEDNRFDGARKYETAYLAPDDGASTSDKELGMVRAISSSEVETDKSPSLNGLREMITTIPTESNASNFVSGYEIPSAEKLFVTDGSLTSRDLGGAPINARDFSGALLTTRLFEGCQKSYIQELETSEGIKYRKVHVETSERSQLGNVQAYNWTCLPNQVIGSVKISIIANPQVFAATLSGHAGILRGVEYSHDRESGKGRINILTAPFGGLSKDRVRVELSRGSDKAFKEVYFAHRLEFISDGAATIAIYCPSMMQEAGEVELFLSLISR